MSRGVMNGIFENGFQDMDGEGGYTEKSVNKCCSTLNTMLNKRGLELAK